MTLLDFKRNRDASDRVPSIIGTCAICPHPILEGEEVERMSGYRLAHSGCYFQALGEEIENHPIGGRLIRGS